MKVIVLADAGSVHTARWVDSLIKEGLNITLFSLYASTTERIAQLVKEKNLRIYLGQASYAGGIIDKQFFSRVRELRSLIKNEKPDILHAHYASSYGLLGALAGYTPFIISVWGSDVFDFPNKGWIFNRLLRYNLSQANMICSSSLVMKAETERYTSTPVEVISFGIDPEWLRPVSRQNRSKVTIGTVKGLAHVYGIDILIRSFAAASADLPEVEMALEIVGAGGDRQSLESLAEELGVRDEVSFHGAVEYEQVKAYLDSFDIFAALSREESFGVAIIEAMSCELPVLVSDAPGPAEIVSNGVDGYVVPREDVSIAADRLKDLVIDASLRNEMGKRGRSKVLEQYSWNDSVKKMLKCYEDLASDWKK